MTKSTQRTSRRSFSVSRQR